MSDFIEFRNCAGCGVLIVLTSKYAKRQKWCSERCRKAQYAGICQQCGAATDGSAGRGPNASKLCGACNTDRIVALCIARGREIQARIEALWADGKTAREIGRAMGWNTTQPSTYIAVLRSRGYDLPYRRTPDQVARITAASDENLRRAREVQRQERLAA